jgi:hypothetical protein
MAPRRLPGPGPGPPLIYGVASKPKTLAGRRQTRLRARRPSPTPQPPHTPPSRAQGFGMEAEAETKRTRESGEDAAAAGISAVIPGWFSEISPMWPGAFRCSAPPIRSAPLLRIVMLSCPVERTHSPFGARIFFFRHCLLMLTTCVCPCSWVYFGGY